MPDRELLDELFNVAHERLIEIEVAKDGFKSIQDVEVYFKKIKVKKLKFFSITKRVQVTKLVVDEPLFVAESLADGLRLEKYQLPESELEIIWK